MGRRVGLWLVGARGGVATTVSVGLAALRNGATTNVGLVSQLPDFQGLDLLDWDQIVVGGHEIRTCPLTQQAQQLMAGSRVFNGQLDEHCRGALAEIDQRIRPGVLFNAGSAIGQLADDPAISADGSSPREAINRLQDDFRSFIQQHQLQRMVVVNLASTEPPIDEQSIPQRLQDLQRSLDEQGCGLASSSLYAFAALDLGIPYINFTPSAGSSLPAISQLAIERETCHMGRDGKTGETLLKSVLAPMFAQRNLEVMSWVGHNIFGNLDGKILDDPKNKQTKITSKDRLIGDVLGYQPQTHVSIEYIESMGDWKTAWDHIHFRGFLGTPMVMQFLWQGCDSILAAPLVIDLFRFTERAARDGATGPLTFLSSFFKSPMGATNSEFAIQHQMLQKWAKCCGV